MFRTTHGEIAAGAKIVVSGTIVLAAAGISVEAAPLLTETQKLIASDGAPSDKFGFAVDREGDTLIIGAPQHYTNALPGSFYVFERDATGQWIQQARVFSDYQPGEAELGDIFGDCLALSGDTLLVGAPLAEQAGEIRVGRVYVFERQGGGAWVKRQILLPDVGTNTGFGEEIVLVGDTAVITGVDRAFVFTRDGSGAWSQQTELQGFDLDSIRALAFDGQRIALTSFEFPTDSPQAVIFTAEGPRWSTPVPLMSSAQGFLVTGGAWFCGGQFALGINDLNSPDYVSLFAPDASGGWSEVQLLTNPDTDDPYPDTHDFGRAIHGDDSSMIVGADQGNRAYVFLRDPMGGWVYTAQLRPTDAYTFAQNFGNEVHLRDQAPVVGSWAHHENGLYAGAVYVFAPITGSAPGDMDGDGDVDLDDHAIFAECMTGPEGSVTTNCTPADLDSDGDADLRDYAVLATES